MKPTPSSAAAAPRWPQLAARLAFLTGMLDMTTWLVLSGFFSANITGDLVESASYLVPGRTPKVEQLLVIPVFFVGVVFTYYLGRRLGRMSLPMVRSVLFTQFVLLTGLWVFSATTRPALFPAGVQHALLGATAVLAVAVSNTAMRLLPKPAPTTWALTANVVTATISLLNLATHYGSAADQATDRQKWHTIWPVLVAFVAGGLSGTIVFSLRPAWSWALPAVTSLVLLALSWQPARLPVHSAGPAR